jgi:electron transfer flavoprotein beta subunit
VNIVVCVKQVPDTEARIRISEDKKSIDESEINFILNPYDEFAVEEALKLKEANEGEVTIISLGPDRISAAIRNALAMGADKAIHVKSDFIPVDPMATANALAEVLKEGSYDVILLGKQAIDDDNSQMGPMLGELMDMPSINVITKLEIAGDSVIAERQIEGGVEKTEAKLPVILTAQRGLNEPRYASLKGIMTAKKIQIEEKTVSINDDKIEIIEYSYPPEKPEGKIVGEGADAVPELIRLLKEEAKVIS